MIINSGSATETEPTKSEDNPWERSSISTISTVIFLADRASPIELPIKPAPTIRTEENIYCAISRRSAAAP